MGLRVIVILLCICGLCAWAEPVTLLSERHRTEWNWVEYRIALENNSSTPILNPEIWYFAANPLIQYCTDYPTLNICATFDKTNPPNDTSLIAHVDNTVYLSAVPTVLSAGAYSVVKLNINGLLYPNSTEEINFRIYRKDWTAWNSTRDWSYQRNAEVFEPNYFMAVYDASGNILWGSDPLNGNSNADVVLWSERGTNTVVERFSGDTSEYIPAGRFWMLKDTPVSPKERGLLAARGVVKHSGGVYQGKTLALFRTESGIRKSMLDSTVAGFYNAFPVNDTAEVPLDLSSGDFFKESEVCNPDGTCHKEVVPVTEIDITIGCWPDVAVGGCAQTIDSCGGHEIGAARGFLVARTTQETLQCLTGCRNVKWMSVEREAGLASSEDRNAVNLSSLQSSDDWISELASAHATEGWLSGVENTGEGIVVGVYDDGFDLTHPDFNEYDSVGSKKLRVMRREEYFGVGYNPDVDYDTVMRKSNLDTASHGTMIAGILGGNGNASGNFEYRGVAPKIHYYFGKDFVGPQKNQIGHVVSHSHITSREGVYNDEVTDWAIYTNWKSGCSKRIGSGNNLFPEYCAEGDTLPKTVVICAGNNGGTKPQHKFQVGFHSIMSNSKNAIIVGNMTSKEKVRFHTSSMGPTWDGRIKPDIMAPGASSQFAASEDFPAEIMIDYVKLFRQGESEPYFVLDFDNHNLPLDAAQAFTGWSIVPISGGSAFDCISTKNKWMGINVIWNMDSINTVRRTDMIEVRLRKIQGWTEQDSIYGYVFFARTERSHPDSSSRIVEQVKNSVVWNVNNEFVVNQLPLISLPDSIDVNYIRLDFGFARGIVAPDVCVNDTCGYAFLPDGGTSEATPFVSGVAALMYQKFRDTTGDSLNRHSMRNSTVKALMIHTAIDMEDSPAAHFAYNPDFRAAHGDDSRFTPYGRGPDFATGWGRIDAGAALGMISGYDRKSREFARFREIEIADGVEKRWTTVVGPGQDHLRATLVWDDAPGERDYGENIWITAKQPKLVNDLDMYLVSPSGEYYYPWRLDSLPTTFIDSNGNVSIAATGLERIHEGDVHDAYNGCTSGSRLEYSCFDHLNNVEVVDVDSPEPGRWQVVVLGRTVREFNNADSSAQVATLVSDLTLSTDESCSVVHDYAPQVDYRCTYPLGKDAISYVTFDERTFTGAGDDIQLFDEMGYLIGTYVGNQLAGKTLKLKARRLTVVLHSDNDESQGWGFGVTRIKVFSKSALKMPFEFTKKTGGDDE